MTEKEQLEEMERNGTKWGTDLKKVLTLKFSVCII